MHAGLYRFWTAMGVESAWADILADLGAHTEDGAVLIRDTHADEPGILERVGTAMLHVWRYFCFQLQPAPILQLSV